MMIDEQSKHLSSGNTLRWIQCSKIVSMKKVNDVTPNCGEHVALNLYSAYDIRKAAAEYLE